MKRLLELLRQVRQHYGGEPDQAQALITSTRQVCPLGVTTTEFATWVTLGNVLLNLDEVFVRN